MSAYKLTPDEQAAVVALVLARLTELRDNYAVEQRMTDGQGIGSDPAYWPKQISVYEGALTKLGGGRS